jgi:hypothetical protein
MNVNDDDFINKLNHSLDNLSYYYNLIDSSNIVQNSDSVDNLNNRFYPIRQQFNFMDYLFSSDSPVLSNSNSDNEHSDLEEEEDCFEESNEYIPKHSLRKLTLINIKRSLDKYYDSEDKYSSELDILTSYLNGQKHMYSKAKLLVQWQLNLLMFPALIGAGATTIFAPFIQTYTWSGAFISGLNALVTICMSIIHYLKLESLIESYMLLISHYARLENSLQMICSKLMFLDNSDERMDLIMKGLDDYEKKMVEIKEMNSCIVPNSICGIFPIISHINIFSFIKRMETYKKNLMLKFKDVKNELRYIFWKFGAELRANPSHPMHKRAEVLSNKKVDLKDELLHYRSAYGYMDELILREIKLSEKEVLFRYCFYHSKKNNFSHQNPVIQQYLDVLFER